MAIDDDKEELSDEPIADLLAQRLAHQQYDSVFSDWHKALLRLRDDPDGAVTAARTLLETISKLVLEELAIQYDPS